MVTKTRQDIINEILKMQVVRQDLRSQERSVVSRMRTQGMQPALTLEGSLRSTLSKILPKHMVPKNVGDYNQVFNPFSYRLEYDLGSNPVLGPTFSNSQSFQVSQNHAFLLTSISRSHNSLGSAGAAAPLQIIFRDNQSTRQFNNTPMPIQMIGDSGEPTLFPSPMLLMPNASFEGLLTSHQPVDFTTAGDGYLEIKFDGFELNPEDASYITDALFL